MYTSLHNHTYSSNIRMIDSINRPKEMIEKAIKLGFNGIAITDHESLSCHVELLKIYDKIKEKNPKFKIIFGNEIYLINDKDYKETNNFYHFILLAKDIEGYQQLRQLSSRAWDRSYMLKGIRRCPTFYSDIEEIIGRNPGHIIGSTACLGGEIDKAIVNKDSDSINNFIPWCIKNFGLNNFYLEMQVSDSQDQVLCNKYIIKLSNYFNIKYIITTDSHYLDKEDFSLFTAFLNSKSSNDRETEYFYKYTYIMSIQEIKEILLKSGLSEEQIKLGIENTDKISEEIENYDFRHSTIVPTIKLPEFKLKHLLSQWYDKYNSIKRIAYSESLQDKYMLYLIECGLLEKKVIINEEKVKRINEELDVIIYISQQLKQDISAYLNLVKVIVDICWNVSVVGVSRGSAGCFFINYLMGITQMNPLEYGIPSFRFLNKARADALPDVDIDINPQKNDDVVKLLKEYFGDNNVINCATFKTEKLKSAVLTCARALNYNNDEAQAIAALVPSKRGIMYSLEECLNGNEEKGLEPIPQFIEKLKSYDKLYQMVEKIEGLPTNASIHASALYIFNDGYNAQNSLMKAPNGTSITSINMHDSDDCGALKMDLLKTDAETKITKALELLIKYKQIEWKGSLRKTYDFYLHPDALEYKNLKMWELAAEGKIQNLFQMDTMVGQSAIKKMRPVTVEELATVNGLIRLTGGTNEESPVDRYSRFKEDISLWYKEMDECGITKQEQEILRKHLEYTYGLCYNQESFMEILMDPQIGNFSLKDADKGRKILSKKKVNDIAKFKEQFLTNNASKSDKFKSYVWDKMIAPQMQYSFNRGHGVGYSLIGVQEMNIATRWNPLFWQCACLCIDSGSSLTTLDDNTMDDNLGDDLEQIEEYVNDNSEEVVAKKSRHVAPNYVKISTAISNAQMQGVIVEVPDINTSEEDFIPDINSNAILYSLKTVVGVSEDLYEKIINHRPFSKISEFIEKVNPTNLQMINLIKSGCFDRITKNSRKITMDKYLKYTALHTIQKKEKLTATQLKQLIELKININDGKFDYQTKLFNFKKYIDKNQFDSSTKRYLLTDESCIKFFDTYISQDLNYQKDYFLLQGKEISIKSLAFTKYYNTKINEVMDYLNSPDGLNMYYNMQIDEYINKNYEKYCQGSLASWEMDTLSFYHEPHELKYINNEYYNIKDFNQLPEISEKFENMCYVAGTVIGSENSKHIVNILTTSGVVSVKFFGDNYIKYNQKISVIDDTTKKKTVIENSWFTRGNKIMVFGQRRENMFISKSGNRQNKMIYLITSVGNDGSLILQSARKNSK